MKNYLIKTVIHIYLNKGDKMTILFYIICYIVLSIAVAYFFKYRKDRAKEISRYSKAKQVANNIYDRKKHNDYMNNPKFSYMSCNKHNPESSFYKKRKPYKNEESQLYAFFYKQRKLFDDSKLGSEEELKFLEIAKSIQKK